MFYSASLLLKLCIVFLLVITPWPNKRLFNLWHDVANKKHVFMQSLSLHKLKFPVKRHTFFRMQDSVSQATTMGMFIFSCEKK